MATSHACQLTLPTREGVEPSCGWSDQVLLCRSVEHVEEEHVVREHVVDERVVLDESLVLMRPVLIVCFVLQCFVIQIPHIHRSVWGVENSSEHDLCVSL